MRGTPALVAVGTLLAMLQGNASAEEQSLDDQCRATIRAQIRGPVCRKPYVDQQGDPCYISPLEAMKFEMRDRIARCVDRRNIRRWQVAR
jgi:hypothetical protein